MVEASPSIPAERAGSLWVGLLGHFAPPAILIAVAQATDFAVVPLLVAFAVAASLGVGMMLVSEWVAPSTELTAATSRERASGVASAFLFGLGFGSVVIVSTYRLAVSLFRPAATHPDWLKLAIALLLGDAVFYGLHRFLNHSAARTPIHRWSRARHAVHHAVPALDFYRGGVFSLFDPVFLGSEVALAVAGAALGLDLVSVVLGFVLFLLLQNSHHVNHNFHIGPLRYVFMDSHAHKMHHCKRGQHVNLAAVLSVWDRLLGTYYEDRSVCAAYVRQMRIPLAVGSSGDEDEWTSSSSGEAPRP
jgi:sterol desaturase/sphingolipid hydroxylase (fatty acid hydroxylase superfamily)